MASEAVYITAVKFFLDWPEWSQWSICAKSCGGSVQYRNRECLLNQENPEICVSTWGAHNGLNLESRNCAAEKCPGNEKVKPQRRKNIVE